MEKAGTEYSFVLLSDEQRQQIIRCVRPGKRLAFSCDNLNLTYGVKSEQSNFVLTLIYYMSDAIKRCDEPDDYRFIVLYPHHEQIIDCQEPRGSEKLILCSRILESENAEIEGAVQFYENHDAKWNWLKEVFGEEHSYSAYAQQNKEYIQKLVLEPEAKQMEEERLQKGTEQEKPGAGKEKTETDKKYTGTRKRETETDWKSPQTTRVSPAVKKRLGVLFAVIGIVMVLSYFVLPVQKTSTLVAGILWLVIAVIGIWFA